MAGRWGSTSDTSRPASSDSSEREPTQWAWPFPHRQTGSGVPQNRSRERAQSTFLASHSPIRPSRMCSGCQPMVWFSATSSDFRSEVFTYQLGLPQ